MKVFLALILLLTPLFAQTTINSVDFNAVPTNQNITFSGSGFTGTTDVSFIFASLFRASSDNVNVIDDNTLEVNYDPRQPIREHIAFIRTPQGSTFTLPEGNDRFGDPLVAEFTGTGALEQFSANGDILSSYVIAKAGSVITSIDHFSLSVLYLEPGATLQQLPQEAFGLIIFAADGATIDFSDFDSEGFSEINVFYSPNTEIIGGIPAVDEFSFSSFEEVSSITYSSGIGTFTEAGLLTLSASGNGTVTSSTDSNFLGEDETFTLTATPSEGAVFSHWQIISSRNGTSIFNENTIEVTTDRFVLDNITATAFFTEGVQLTTYATTGGTVIVTPDLANFNVGDSVRIEAIPDEGYEFVRWSYGPTANTEASVLNEVLDRSTDYVAVFRLIDPVNLTLLTSANHNVLPENETITFEGIGLSDVTNVNFIFSSQNTASLNVNPIDSNRLEVSYDAFQPSREHIAFVQGATGSTFTLPVGNDRFGNPQVSEFTGIGPLEEDFSSLSSYVIAKSGSIITNIDSFSLQILYLEPGATLQQIPENSSGLTIFAADNSVLDFRNYNGDDFSGHNIFYSPDTLILGDVPVSNEFSFSTIEEVSSISYSSEIGTFTEAGLLVISVSGNGTVTSSKDSNFLAQGETFSLTATPSNGSVFSHWQIVSSRNGMYTSEESTVEVTTDEFVVDNITATAFFTDAAGVQLRAFTTAGGNVTITPNQAVYNIGDTVRIEATPNEGYEFVKWSYGPTTNTQNAVIDETVNRSTDYVAVFRLIDPINPTLLTTASHNVLPEDEVITFTGDGLSDITNVSFIFSSQNTESNNVSPINENVLEASYNAFQIGREHIAFVRGATGSTFTLPEGDDRFGNPNVTEATIIGALEVDSNSLSSYVIAKSGSVITSIDSSSLQVLYLEPGATLQQIPENISGLTIFAADNSVLDFRNFNEDSFSNLNIFYSPETLVLGDVPVTDQSSFSTVEQVASISYSSDIGTFTEGCALEINAIGPGSVSVSPDKEFYSIGETVEITATPDQDAFFIRWLNGVTSLDPITTIEINRDCTIGARFSDRPDFFTDWRVRFFTEEQIADPGIVGFDQDPDGDGISNLAEYAFGTDPTSNDQGGGVTINSIDSDNKTISISYQRPTNAADLLYNPLASMDGNNYSDGDEDFLKYTYVEVLNEGLEEGIEKVTYLLTFEEELPRALFFRITAEFQ